MKKSLPEPRTIVYQDPFQIITWNRGATFNVYFQMEQNHWVNVDCFTVYDVKDKDQARNIAQQHADEANKLIGD